MSLTCTDVVFGRHKVADQAIEPVGGFLDASRQRVLMLEPTGFGEVWTSPNPVGFIFEPSQCQR